MNRKKSEDGEALGMKYRYHEDGCEAYESMDNEMTREHMMHMHEKPGKLILAREAVIYNTAGRDPCFLISWPA